MNLIPEFLVPVLIVLLGGFLLDPKQSIDSWRELLHREGESKEDPEQGRDP